jgi:hypothetical protein
MKFISNADIWPGKNNGVLVEKESSGSTYQTVIPIEEYRLEEFLLTVEQDGITSTEQVEDLRNLISEYAEMQYQRGYNNCEMEMNDQ